MNIKNLSLGCLIVLGSLLTFSAKSQSQVGLPLYGVAHLEDRGDVSFSEGNWVIAGKGKRLEGFLLTETSERVSIEYMCHVQDLGDIGWFNRGNFCGTRGRGKRLEGFALKLAGANRNKYDIKYQCHVQDIGNSKVLQNGQYCGTRGQGKRVEGMRVWITSR